MTKRVMKAERHVRWNWERASSYGDEGDSEEMARYHFVVDDRDRIGTMNRLVD